MVLEFLNQNEAAFTVIFSAVVATATIVYAILTWRLVSETKKMRKVQTEPKISVIVQPKEEWIGFIDMIIQNIGLGPAYDIKFEIEPDYEKFDGKLLSEYGFIKNGLKYFGPNQKMQFFFTDLSENYEEKRKHSFEIKVSYQNSVGNSYEDIYIIDFSQFDGLDQLGNPPLHEIADNIKRIQTDIKLISSGFHRMKVIMYTKEDMEEERKQFLDSRNQSKTEDKN